MTSQETPLTAAAIKYLLALADLDEAGKGVRSVDLAEQLHVTKPSAHAMLRNLSAGGLVEKKKYGAVYLTEYGRALAASYTACFQPLHERLHRTLGLDEASSKRAACAVLAEVPEQLEHLKAKLYAEPACGD